jgi:glycine hydroxymethyltransferase
VIAQARGFTQSHHVALSAQPFGGGTHAARALEESLILTSGIEVPGPAVAGDYSGLRLGTQEITRWGMQPMHMPWIAHEIADRLLERRRVREVQADIEQFRAQFQQLHFVLNAAPFEGRSSEGALGDLEQEGRVI